MTTRAVGIAHLTLLSLSPRDLVHTAAAAGYDFVGIRVRAATAGEFSEDLRPGSVMSRQTRMALDDTGLTVRDIEFLPITAHTVRAEWISAFEAGAEWGAQTLSVAGIDDDFGRLTETLAQIVEDGRAYGIRPTLEPISYNAVSTVAQAAQIARASGAAVLLDPLHIHRGGSTIDDVLQLEADLVPVLQLCDAALLAPESLAIDAPMPRGMTTNGSPLQLESRAWRQVLLRGELPLHQLLAAVPDGIPVSVEVPNAPLQATMSPLEFAVLNRQAVSHLLDQAHQLVG
ncbi:sugar phosphate isomerase/epimerase family protein [Cryobacterium aureum]|uniref:sugar phosphate isomerase/epimerase family protein n=1 Tax=Cryobacterium aureum TaxID=995037 RepID=UPI000CF4E278|nr:TIM barrel protein [Cryobacterium aureum]